MGDNHHIENHQVDMRHNQANGHNVSNNDNHHIINEGTGINILSALRRNATNNEAQLARVVNYGQNNDRDSQSIQTVASQMSSAGDTHLVGNVVASMSSSDGNNHLVETSASTTIPAGN